MIASQHREVSTHEPNWQREAARLAQLKLPFVVTGFSASLDNPFVDKLAKKFGLNLTIDSAMSRAYFRAATGS